MTTTESDEKKSSSVAAVQVEVAKAEDKKGGAEKKDATEELANDAENSRKQSSASSSEPVDGLSSALGRMGIADDGGNIESKKKDDENIPAALRTVANWIEGGTCRRILVLSGAGVSVAAGIPDFRTPGTGLYDNLQKFGLPFPEAVFELNFYRHNPGPFCTLASELWPGENFHPTLTHSFVSMLASKDLLLRNYSQNIDGLEFLAGIPADLLVECHGHFRSASCTKCGKKADAEAVKETIVKTAKPPICEHCGGYVKPDIVFFGESLPERFSRLIKGDLEAADMCLVLGTSLQVAPVSMIPEMVGETCKRVLLNREAVGPFAERSKPGQRQERDLFRAGDCDDSVRLLARLLGWEEELDLLHAKAKAAQQKSNSTSGGDKASTAKE